VVLSLKLLATARPGGQTKAFHHNHLTPASHGPWAHRALAHPRPKPSPLAAGSSVGRAQVC
jgi:hypothetical protein